jgi:hypothetical protein
LPNSGIEIPVIFNSTQTNSFDCSITDRMYLLGSTAGTTASCSSDPTAV